MTTPHQAVTLPATRARKCPFDPPPVYQQAHTSTGPVSQVSLFDGTKCWLVTGHQESRSVLQDRRFSADVRTPGFPFLTPSSRQFVDGRKPSFLRLDDPEHARQRRMLTSDFIIKRVESQRPQIQQIVDDALDRMIAAGSPADLVADFALPVPSLVICLLLGVPYDDHAYFQQQSSTLLNLTAGPEQFKAAMDGLTDYLTELARSKQREPDDSVLGRLVARNELTLEECASMGVLLLVAGHETTANMIALGTLALLRNPEQLARLRAEPGLINGAVEELLRYLTIVHLGVPRAALEDIELGGQLIRAGEGVFCMVSVANRDEQVFPGGEELDVSRDARRHLAFGFGVHQCIGQPLARAEMQIGLATLLRRLPELRLAIPFEEVEFRTDMGVYGVHRLPVAW